MIEIRFNGRGGQGAVSAAEIMVEAIMYEGKFAQAFPMFSGERRGAPVESFLRIDDRQVRVHQQCTDPDICVILDSGLVSLIPWYIGLRQGGTAIINWKDHNLPIIPIKISKLGFVDATSISIQTLGYRAIPITNTAMLGALIKTTELVSVDNVNKAIKNHFKEEVAEKNINALNLAYEKTNIIKY